MEIMNKEYLVSPKSGQKGTLRISQELARELPNEIIQGRAETPDGRPWPIRISVKDRTLDGLEPWLKTLGEGSYHSFKITLIQKEPLKIKITLSNEAPKEKELPLSRPVTGIYLGREYEDRMLELIPTTNTFTMLEDDLVKHTFICGVTGSGKTVLAKALLEEAALKGIPSIAIDLKGDISSLGIIMSGEDPEEFLPWVKPVSGQSKEELAGKKAEEHLRNLRNWGISSEDIRMAKEKIAVNIFTPRSNDGFRLALSAIPEPPKDIERLKQEDEDAYNSAIDFLAKQFVSRLSLPEKLKKKSDGYLFEIIRTCYERSLPLRGYEGVKRILDEITSPSLGIDIIGGLKIDEYISSKDRVNIADAVNALLTGANRGIYEGYPIDIENLIDTASVAGKTPVSVINLHHLEFLDQAFVTGYIAYMIYFWMRQKEGADYPRLIFYIDEIGSGGGKQAFFPSTAITPSKPALNLLLREGRAWGVCCVFATQNPGDIDYKGLSNCGTWMVGQLKTKRDIAKIEQGAATADFEFESAKGHLPTLKEGKFVLRCPSTTWKIIGERWLMGIHRPLSSQEIRYLKKTYEDEARSNLEAAEELIKKNNLANASNLLHEVIHQYPFSVYVPKAYIRLARVFLKQNKLDEAISELQNLLVRWPEQEELAETYFLLGCCYEGKGEFVKAEGYFARASDYSQVEELRNQTKLHESYCSARATWPTLNVFQKFVWWIIGRKPDEGHQIEVHAGDEKALDASYQSILAETDFTLPPVVDYKRLLSVFEASRSESEVIDGKRIQTERWAQDRALRISELLDLNQINEAATLGQRIIQRLTDSKATATESVIETLSRIDDISNQRQKNLQKKILQLKARQFEYEVARLLTLSGFDGVYVTQSTGDGGVDVYATKDREKIIVQCKRWESRPVGRAVVDELAGVRVRVKADHAIVVSTSSFSDDAILAAKQNNIELWDFREMCRRLSMSNENSRIE